MLFWILFVALLVAVVVLALMLVDQRYRWHWERLSLEARLRRASESAEAHRATLGRLRADRGEGKLVINDDYANLFDRLTQAGAGD